MSPSIAGSSATDGPRRRKPPSARERTASSVGGTPSEPSLRVGEIIELSRPECLRLLATTSFGRVAVNGSSGPVIRPVSYAFDAPSNSVIFRTGLGSKLHALLKASRAAFEVDGADPADRTGWSVIIMGVTEEVTNLSELHRLETIGVDPLAPGDKSHWVRIRANTVSGRRIVHATDAAPDPARS